MPVRSPIWAPLALTLLFSTSNVPAEANGTTVYKRTMPDGSVSYSDRADSQAEKMEVQPVSTVPALKVGPNAALPLDQNTVSAAYEKFSFVNPANDSAFWSGNGSVNVQLELKPALQGNHRIILSMDGQRVTETKTTSFTLPLVDRGTHSLRAEIVDSQGNTVSSTSSTFTIHRPIAKPKITTP